VQQLVLIVMTRRLALLSQKKQKHPPQKATESGQESAHSIHLSALNGAWNHMA